LPAVKCCLPDRLNFRYFNFPGLPEHPSYEHIFDGIKRCFSEKRYWITSQHGESVSEAIYEAAIDCAICEDMSKQQVRTSVFTGRTACVPAGSKGMRAGQWEIAGQSGFAVLFQLELFVPLRVRSF